LLDAVQKHVDDVVGGDAVGVGVEVGDDAVAQHGVRDLLDILDARQRAPVHYGAHLGAQNEILSRARAGAPRHVLLHLRDGVVTRGAHEADGVLQHVRVASVAIFILSGKLL
jgi:hypothetical protein